MSALQAFDEWLNPAEVKTLAGGGNVDEQEAVLKRDGIPYRRRERRILVSRYHAREWVSGRAVTPSRGVNLALVK